MTAVQVLPRVTRKKSMATKILLFDFELYIGVSCAILPIEVRK